MSKVKEYSIMNKDTLMLYTFVALLVLVGVSFLSFGLTSLITTAIAVLIAVGIDLLISKVASDAEPNIMSAAVFGLIVALSYSLGLPTMRTIEALALEAPDAYFFVAAISAIGMTLFKKLSGRKRVNPAAAAKILVLLPFLNSMLLAKDHLIDGLLKVPSLAGPIGYTVLGSNGDPIYGSFANYIVTCFADPAATVATTVTQSDIIQLLLVQKFHGWAGGISSIAVLAVGIALFVVAKKYIKWRITVSYLISMAVLALALGFVYGDVDPLLRVIFHLFIGSSIFLAFFMATDPGTTPITYPGQLIFGAGLAVLTILIQTYMGFFGGSILALVIMNLTCPFLDKVGLKKTIPPVGEKMEVSLPSAKQFTKVKVYECMRCGHCLEACCYRLSPILIKEAFEQQKVEKLIKLNADYCDGCGQCSFVCPSRIDLRSFTLRAKAFLKGQ
jgi:electron transport complex protein RnfD